MSLHIMQVNIVTLIENALIAHYVEMRYNDTYTYNKAIQLAAYYRK